jgi:hypothetical protein
MVVDCPIEKRLIASHLSPWNLDGLDLRRVDGV